MPHQIANCRPQLALADDHHRPDERLHHRKRDVVRVHVAGQAVGNRRADLHLDDPASGEGCGERRRCLDLHADDLDLGPDFAGRDCDSREQSAASDRHDDPIDSREVLDHLERDGTDRGQQVRMAVRREVPRARVGGVLFRESLGILVGLRDGAQVRAEASNRIELGGRRRPRREDDRPHAGVCRGPRQRAAVIPGRRRDEARQGSAGSVLLDEREYRVERAARLERSGHLERLELEVDVTARDPAEPVGSNERRLANGRGDALARAVDVGEGDADHLTL